MKNFLTELSKLDLAKKWIHEAGEFLKAHMNEPLEISEKTRFDDLVTNFDLTVQKQLVAQISKHFPADKILAEEDEDGQKVRFSKEIAHLWLIDPIDGTTNFIAQRDNFAIMLAYYEHGKGKFGLIFDVMNDNLYWCDDENAYRNETQLNVPNIDLQHSLLGVNAYMYRTNKAGLLDLSQHSLGVRVTGSAGISYTQILDGKLIAYFSNLQPWDYAAGTIISEKLGYVTRNLSGTQPSFDGREEVYTAPAKLLPEIQKYIKMT
ncbi:inositol monophosphatase family protein [Lactococcus nasutitermitis]|uniref:Inositol monophosphatase family protein n=1 Tax=Lactococcus nasutitermitis TaxID=1652957 RepID=A0ABV9JEH4_9LACT|nr:inositol monophosphatase family protein [Lactococcus nasutitermitis]